MKQTMIAMLVVLLAAAVFVLMVTYSVWVIRSAQLRILTGEMCCPTWYWHL